MQALKKKAGYTLVELSLSLIFIGILSLTVAYVINDTIKTYRRGVTLSQINLVGMDLVDDMRTMIQRSTYAEKEGVKVVKTNRGTVKIRGEEIYDVPLSGAFCTGTYSYVWNSGYYYDGKNELSEDSKAITINNGEPYRLARIEDKEKKACEDNNKLEGDFSPVELLGGSGNNEGLALYSLEASNVGAENVNSLLYSVSFTLGTVQGGPNVLATGNKCAPPSDYENENFDYCAINNFNFVVQATGGGKIIE